MTEIRAPYDAGLHPGYRPIARAGDYRVARHNGKTLLLTDDGRVLPVNGEAGEALWQFAQAVARLRDGLAEVMRPPIGPLRGSRPAGGMNGR